MDITKSTIDTDELNLVCDTLKDAAELNPKTAILREVMATENIEDLNKIQSVADKTTPIILPDPEVDATIKIDPPIDNEFGTYTEEELAAANLPDITIPDKAVLESQGVFDPNEILAILDIHKRIIEKEHFSIYNALPESFKSRIKTEAVNLGVGDNRSALNLLARTCIETIISESNIDKEFDDFTKELNAASQMPNIIDLYSEHLKELMEVKFLEKAEAIKDSNPESYEKIINTSKAFTSAYMLDRQFAYVENNANDLIKLNKKIIDKRFTRACDDYDFTLSKVGFKASSIKTMVAPLVKIVKLNESQAKKIIVILCELCKNMQHENIADMTFMYYSAKLVCNLVYIDEHRTDFSELVIKNIIDLNNAIENKLNSILEV